MTRSESSPSLPVGRSLADWKPCLAPPTVPMMGRYSSVFALDPSRHGPDLFQAFREDRENRIWTYLPYGPFAAFGEFENWMEVDCCGTDPMFHAIVDAESGRAVGVASYLRIQPQIGVIEVGHINYSPMLQRSLAATEAMYLMMHRVFSMGYRRYEWKCDALNERSKRAAGRLGFKFEGIFRNATIYKQRNRDTAWYSIIDSEWPSLDRAFRGWLDPGNFDQEKKQIHPLLEFRKREEAAG